jgi:hypothetical protein
MEGRRQVAQQNIGDLTEGIERGKNREILSLRNLEKRYFWVV